MWNINIIIQKVKNHPMLYCIRMILILTLFAWLCDILSVLITFIVVSILQRVHEKYNDCT